MSLYGMMKTGVSGMAAQSNRLGTVGDNIANSGTTGYKGSKAEFSSMVIPGTPGSYNSGGVNTTIQKTVTTPGALQYTSSGTDLAIEGEGFFVVQGPEGQPVLTRAGSFVPDNEGRLVNAAGYQLLGYSYANGEPTPTANGYDGLEPVTIADSEMVASPSENGFIYSNLPDDAEEVTGDLPSDNTATSEYSEKTSLVAYDNLGNEKLLDIYYTKTADDTWEVAAFDRDEATPETSFPYGSGPLATETLTFDPTNGQLDGASPTGMDIPVPDGETLSLDLSSTSQLASEFSVLDSDVDGASPNSIESVEISPDGTVAAQYGDGSFRSLYRAPLANVQSPDMLTQLSGNTFTESAESGGVSLGFAGESGMGEITSGALENSNVDIAEELTTMIQSQRSYTANSKVFQTGSDLMDLLVNLQR